MTSKVIEPLPMIQSDKNSKNIKSGAWDKLGIVLSGACVIHCLAMPILFLFFPVVTSKFLPEEDMTHAIFLGFILGIAGVAFVTGYRKHRNYRPIIWMLFGITLIVYSTYVAHDQMGHYWEPIIAIIGSLGLIRAHQLNHVSCKTCEENHKHHH